MKIFGLETTGSFTGDISGSVTSTGSFGSVTIGTGAKNTFYGLTIQDDQTAGIALNDTGQGGPYQIAANGSVLYIRYNGENTRSIFLNSSGNVGIGGNSTGFKLHVSGSTDILNLEGSGAGGPQLRMTDNSATSDGDAFGLIDFSAKDHAGNATVMNRISNVVVDNTQGTTDSRLTIQNRVAGTLTEVLSVASGNVGIGTSSPTKRLHVSQSSGTSALIDGDGSGNDPILHVRDRADTFVALFEGNRAADTGAQIRLRHNPASPSSNNRTFMNFEMPDAGGTATTYAQLFSGIDDNTNTSEDGNFRISIMKNGTLTEQMRINSTGVGINQSSPDSLLHIVNPDSGTYRFGYAGTSDVYIDSDNVYLRSDNGNVNYVTFKGDGSNVKVGIGTTSPEVALDVVGDVKIKGDLTAETLIISSSVTNLTTQFASGSTRFGDTQDDLHEFTGSLMVSGARISFTNGKTGTFIGLRAGSGTGIQNVAIGDDALASTTDGMANTAVGNSAMATGNAGDSNTGIGGQSLVDVTGNNNTAVGFQSAFNLTSAVGTTAIGYRSMYIGTATGDYNTTLGAFSGYALTSGAENVLIGREAGVTLTTTSNTIIIGAHAGYALNSTDANGSVLVGHRAGLAITSGIGNIAIGSGSLSKEDDGDFNTAIGYQALTDQTGTTGAVANTAVGYKAGAGVTSGVYNTYIGHQSGLVASGSAADLNTGVGYRSLEALTSGSRNTALGGFSALQFQNASDIVALGHYSLANANTSTDIDGGVAIGSFSQAEMKTGQGNVSVGFRALQADVHGDYSTAIGYKALRNQNGISGQVGNTAVGYQAGLEITSGKENTFVGFNSGDATTTGLHNTALGSQAFSTNVDGDHNTVVGYASLYTFEASSDGNGKNSSVGSNSMFHISTGQFNAGLGYEAVMGVSGQTNTTSGSIGVGYRAGGTITTGNNNIAIGLEAMYGANIASDNNIAIGAHAGDALTTGRGLNVLIGKDAGGAITSGVENVIIGANAAGNDVDAGNCIAIGSGVTGVTHNSVTLGNADVTDVYMAQDSGATVHAASLLTSGNVSGSSTSTGSFGMLHLKGPADDTDRLILLDDGSSYISGITKKAGSMGGLFVRGNGSSIGILTNGSYTRNPTGDTVALSVNSTTSAVTFPVANQLISGSSTSTGSFGKINAADHLSVGFHRGPSFTTDASIFPLHVLQTDTDDTGAILVQNSNAGDAGIAFNISGQSFIMGIDNSATGDPFVIADSLDLSSTARMTIASDGVISGDFNDTSDIALKENIFEISSSYEQVKQLNPVTFNWKEEEEKGTDEQIGFIAQEVEKVYPQLVEGEEGNKSVNVVGLVSVLTKAVQELSEKVESQQKEIEELKSK